METNLTKDDTVALIKQYNERPLYCYPWDKYSIKNITSFNHKPYIGGWCNTCDPYDGVSAGEGGGAGGGDGESKERECKVTPEDNWGWCLPGCDESLDEQTHDTFRRNVHELPVDAFVYENCSISVDTLSEFCTGSTFHQGKMSEYLFQEEAGKKNPFTFIKTTAKTWHSGDIGWNGDHTIIRPGARYQGRQHSSLNGDNCFGDAGGAVWKFWTFRNPSSTSKTWIQNTNQKLAVLTGVISRYEEMCGAFSPWPSQEFGDQPNLPTQHTVHARVQVHLSWIMRHVFLENSCEPK